jgi:hypothetical protein
MVRDGMPTRLGCIGWPGVVHRRARDRSSIRPGNRGEGVEVVDEPVRNAQSGG